MTEGQGTADGGRVTVDDGAPDAPRADRSGTAPSAAGPDLDDAQDRRTRDGRDDGDRLRHDDEDRAGRADEDRAGRADEDRTGHDADDQADDGSSPWRPLAWDAPTAVLPTVPGEQPAARVTPVPPPSPPAPTQPMRVSAVERLRPGAEHRPDDGLGTASDLGAATSDHDDTTDQAPATQRAESPMSVFEEERPVRRWPRVLGLLLASLVVLGGAYVGALWFWQDRVPPGATVAGVAVGGMAADEAVGTLTSSLEPVATEPIPVTAGEQRTTLDPAAAGLTFDAAATVDRVTGFGLEPVRIWHQVFGSGEIEPVTTVDSTALRAAVVAAAESLEVAPVEGSVVFVDNQPQAVQAAEGAEIDVDAAVALVAEDWLTAARPLELPTEVTAPVVGPEEVETVLETVARPLASAPVSVAVGDQLAELPVDVVTGAASFVPEGESLVLQLDGEALVAAVLARTTALLTEPVDATFQFVGGVPTIVPGVPGTTLDPAELAAAVAAAGTGPDRTARIALAPVEPARSTAALEALGVTQVVSEFSTPLTSEPRRTGNIVNGASKINGRLVLPGEIFSLTEALGPIDAANGYVEAGAIINGEHVDAWGGGLSQISTTTYNAAYLAGFEDVEHHPHSEWFARYPEGREATIFTGTLDMRWRNNTPYGALVQAFVEGGRVHVKIWGTPHWTVESSTSPRSNVVAPTTVYSQTETCEPQAAGNPGFTVTVTRRVLLAGVEQDTESWTVRYRPQNHIICGAPPAG